MVLPPGLSVKDGIELLQWLLDKYYLVRKGAVRGFDRFDQVFKGYRQIPQQVSEFVSWDEARLLPIFEDHIKGMLQNFRATNQVIEQLRPALGSQSKQSPWQTFLPKLGWPKKLAELETMHKSLRYQMDQLSFLVNLQNAESLRYLVPMLPDNEPFLQRVTKRFILEDAQRYKHSVAFADVSTWDFLHELLQRIHDHGDERLAVDKGQYLVRNTSTDASHLPAGRCTQIFEDSVPAGSTLQMSVVFPYKALDDSECPRCQKTWQRRYNEAIMTC